MHAPLGGEDTLAVSCPHLCHGPSQAVLTGNNQRLSVALGILTGLTSACQCGFAGEGF